MATQLWYDKYLPASLDEYVWFSDDFRAQVEAWIANPANMPHLILGGPTGTGKTSLARLLKQELQVEDVDFLFMNASKDSGINVIREDIVSFCEVAGFSGLKLVVMDECERLTRDAQEMLRGVMDQYGSVVRFIFTCNEPSRVIGPLSSSRCIPVEVAGLNQEQFLNRLIDICVAENIACETDEEVKILVDLVERTYPNMRAAINQLQQQSLTGSLSYPSTKAKAVQPWESFLEQFLEAPQEINEIRETMSVLRRDEMEAVYKWLYERSDRFAVLQGEAIVAIADHLYRHGLSGFPEINLCGCLIKLKALLGEMEP